MFNARQCAFWKQASFMLITATRKEDRYRYYFVTIHQFRQQGIRGMMTLMAAKEARQAGYRIGILTASPMGINIYRRLALRRHV
jgi:hypothetical protein